MSIYEHVSLRPVVVHHPHTTFLLAFIFFYSVDFILRYFGFICKNGRDSLEKCRFRNYCISVLHAFMSGMASLYCLYSFPELTNDIIGAEVGLAYNILAFASGYFVHDVYHNICGGLCLRSMEIILHHITVVTCFYIVWCYRILVCYALFGLLMEINSIFLHGRKVMAFMNIMPESLPYRLNAIANVVTFIVFRIILTVTLFLWAIVNRTRLPVFISTILLLSFTILTTMNFVLFFRVLSSERRLFQGGYSKKSLISQK